MALNLAVIGIFVGAATGFRDGGPAPRVDFSLGPLGRALDDEDRRAIGRSLRERDDLRRSGPRDWRAGLEELAAIVAADPFDPDALQTYLEGIRGHGAAMIEAGQVAMIDRIATMTAEERAALADRLLTEGFGRDRPVRDRDDRDHPAPRD